MQSETVCLREPIGDVDYSIMAETTEVNTATALAGSTSGGIPAAGAPAQKEGESAKSAAAPNSDKATQPNAVPGVAGEKDKKAAVAEAAKVAARNFAKAGVESFRKLGGGIVQKVFGPLIAILALPLQLFRGTLASRLVTLGFVASVLLILITGGKLLNRFFPNWKNMAKPTETGSSFNKYLEQQKEYAIASASVVFLERYTSTLSSEGGKVRFLELELYAECDAPDTCRAVKARMIDVREVITTAIQGLSYDSLITEPGKEQLKKDLIKALNGGLEKWSVKGSIRRIFITSFVMA